MIRISLLVVLISCLAVAAAVSTTPAPKGNVTLINNKNCTFLYFEGK